MLSVQLTHQSPMTAMMCSILSLAILDLVVLLIAPHPLQSFNGLDLCVPLETKCPNPVGISKVLHPDVQETHMLQTFTSLLTLHSTGSAHLLSKVAMLQFAYSQLLPKLTHCAPLHSVSRIHPAAQMMNASDTWPCSCSTCPKCKICCTRHAAAAKPMHRRVKPTGLADLILYFLMLWPKPALLCQGISISRPLYL